MHIQLPSQSGNETPSAPRGPVHGIARVRVRAYYSSNLAAIALILVKVIDDDTRERRVFQTRFTASLCDKPYEARETLAARGFAGVSCEVERG